MAYHVFNIGRPPTTAWWQQNLARRVITAGFEGEAGDRGDQFLRGMEEGDWILAYCIGHGFVGAGVVGTIQSYRLHPAPPPGSLSDHRHERDVDWRYAVQDVADAISLADAGTHAPRNTKEREANEVVAKRIVDLLKARPDSRQHTVKYFHVLEAVRAIGRPCSIRQIKEWLRERYPDENSNDARDNACVLSVNDANRRHHDHGRRDFRTDSGNRKDVLYRQGRHRDVTYVLYRPTEHGVWDIRTDAQGNFEAVQVAYSPLQEAFVEAQQLVATELSEAISSDEDGRVRELRAVILRQGQSEFRGNLLNAYGGRCAMTDCAVEEILEAAHIRPYLGPETNRTDNGLLLRADIHTLFDRGLLWLDDGFLIRISDRLRGSDYEALEGKQLRVPVELNSRPHPEHIAHHRGAALSQRQHP